MIYLGACASSLPIVTHMSAVSNEATAFLDQILVCQLTLLCLTQLLFGHIVCGLYSSQWTLREKYQSVCVGGGGLYFHCT